MTNDELEAVRARAAATLGSTDTRGFYAGAKDLIGTDIPALLDEVERLRTLAFFNDKTPEGLPYKTLWDEAIKMGAEDVREVMARATRAEAAEAEGERRRKEMAVEITGLRRSYTDEKVKAARAESHAGRLASALGVMVRQEMGRTSGMAGPSPEMTEARQALSAYNQRTET